MAHIVFRLDSSPVRILNHPDEKGVLFHTAIVGGARTRPYFKETQPSASVGMMLRPGTLELLSGKPASSFTNSHMSLHSLWSASTVNRLTEQLRRSTDPSTRLDIIEEFLTTKLPIVQGIHPAIAHALDRLPTDSALAEIVAETSLSHRYFIKLFESTTGLTPKRYRRLIRFNRVLQARRDKPEWGWADIAADSGFVDQAHLNREFRQISGTTPTRYSKIALNGTHHMAFNLKPTKVQVKNIQDRLPEPVQSP